MIDARGGPTARERDRHGWTDGHGDVDDEVDVIIEHLRSIAEGNKRKWEKE